MKRILLVVSLLFLFVLEMAKVYLIMPFPGSQHKDTIAAAYWIDGNISWLRWVLLLPIAYLAITVFRKSARWKKLTLAGVLLLYGIVFYYTNFKFLADKMFIQPVHKDFHSAGENKVDGNRLVIAVSLNGEAKAYPIQIIGYHHQVTDTIGMIPVIVTYCTVCRTGRVYSPEIKGKVEKFRLVGMDHFNAMFEDETTRSWWRQVTGAAIAGPLKGSALTEIPSRQMTLQAWLKQYPHSLVLQPDSTFKKRYDDLADFDKGTVESGLEKRDSASWNLKSWVVGVTDGKNAKAYDWNELVRSSMIQDSIADTPLLLLLGSDTASFYAYSRNLEGAALQFERDTLPELIRDINTKSSWNVYGLCTQGPMKGKQLSIVPAYQEFWHSWKTFHPWTTRFENKLAAK